MAIGRSGREIPCENLELAIRDCFDHGHMDFEEYDEQITTLGRHMYRGELPGARNFFSVYNGMFVRWPTLVDHYITMVTDAFNWLDQTDDESTVTGPTHDLWNRPMPTNIGVFRIDYSTEAQRWGFDVESLPVEDSTECDTTMETTFDDENDENVEIDFLTQQSI